MLEDDCLKRMSYGNLMSLLDYGELSFKDKRQVIKEACRRPYADKKLFKLLKKHGDIYAKI